MRNIHPIEGVSEFRCDYIYRLDSDSFGRREPDYSVDTIAHSLDSIPGGFIVSSESLEEDDYYLEGTAHYYGNAHTPSGPLHLFLRDIAGTFIISELSHGFATIIPELSVRENPGQFVTPRIKKLAQTLTTEQMKRFDIDYLLAAK